MGSRAVASNFGVFPILNKAKAKFICIRPASASQKRFAIGTLMELQIADLCLTHASVLAPAKVSPPPAQCALGIAPPACDFGMKKSPPMAKISAAPMTRNASL